MESTETQMESNKDLMNRTINAWRIYAISVRQRFWNTLRSFEKRYELPQLYGDELFQARTVRYQTFKKRKSNPQAREEFLKQIRKIHNTHEIFNYVYNKDKI